MSINAKVLPHYLFYFFFCCSSLFSLICIWLVFILLALAVPSPVCITIIFQHFMFCNWLSFCASHRVHVNCTYIFEYTRQFDAYASIRNVSLSLFSIFYDVTMFNRRVQIKLMVTCVRQTITCHTFHNYRFKKKEEKNKHEMCVHYATGVYSCIGGEWRISWIFLHFFLFFIIKYRICLISFKIHMHICPRYLCDCPYPDSILHKIIIIGHL